MEDRSPPVPSDRVKDLADQLRAAAVVTGTHTFSDRCGGEENKLHAVEFRNGTKLELVKCTRAELDAVVHGGQVFVHKINTHNFTGTLTDDFFKI